MLPRVAVWQQAFRQARHGGGHDDADDGQQPKVGGAQQRGGADEDIWVIRLGEVEPAFRDAEEGFARGDQGWRGQ